MESSAAFGGGSDPSGSQPSVALVSLRTDGTAGHVDVLVNLVPNNVSGCVGADQVVLTSSSLPLSVGHSFESSGGLPGDDNPSDSYQLSGHFQKADLATGTVTARVGTCHFPTMRWWAGDPGASLGSGAEHGGLYVGYLSQSSMRIDVQIPMVLRVSIDGSQKTVTAATHVNSPYTGTAADCVPQEGGGFDDVIVRNGATGGFSFSGSLTPQPAASGEESVTQLSWSGTFGSRSLHGAWEEQRSLQRQADGTLLGECTSGPLTWEAIAVS